MNADKPTPATVLIEIEGSNVTVYGDKHIQVRIINVPTAPTPRSEIALEEFIEENLPRRYSDIRWPWNIRERGQVETLTLDDIERRVWRQELLDAINGVPTRRDRKILNSITG